ncbi:type 1 glutamine amidotransferase domain-containing protein [Rhodococcoides kroppenstedtii]|uniref:type 1 glutamine amidotransferase domain-containing protein n=1 Tax=Rhodococcoides kroppenstedtii TaxID=293050 RepID=UPI001BDDCC11|nr:type 1 glutamine amidotransferase domain-containing protein [Rhodococcus kroppenstedtii]MBT1191065.1 type 1 glutamine amidotransferase [Rhodococcus kroppenstedtii]
MTESTASPSLTGRTVAFLATDGVEQAELTDPRTALEEAGATTVLISLTHGEIQAYESDVNPADTFAVDAVVADASIDDYDALVLPGGTTNPDALRTDADAVAFVRDFVGSGRPVGVICHGPWTLVEADVVRGRTLTSYPSVRTDIRNAGGTVVDEEVVVDGNLVSSRNPDDLPAFGKALVTAVAEAEGRPSGA